MSKYNVEYILNLKDRVSGQLQKISSKVGQFDSAMTSLSESPLVMGGGIAALGVIANQVKDTTVEFQRLQTVLNTSFGSEGAAGAAFNRIQEFAARTPYSVAELTDAFVKLKNRGFDPTNDELEKLGDLAASQGKSFGQLTEAILDAQTGEFERLKEFGIKANKEGGRVKIAFKGATKEIDFTNEAITNTILGLGAMEGVAGGMEAQSKTLGGQLSNLSDSFDSLYFAIGNLATLGGAGSGGIIGSIGKHIDNLSTVTSNFSKIWGDVDTGVGEKLLHTVSNTGDVLLTNLPFVSQFYDVSPYISSHDAMINRIEGARNVFRDLTDEQQAFYSATFQQEKYNKLLERNAEVMGMTVDKFKEYIGLTKQMTEGTGPAQGSIEAYEKQIKEFKELQKEATTRGDFLQRQKDIDRVQRQIDRITGGKKGAGASGSTATSSTLTSRSPQTFNINITKLVETINTTKPQLNTTDTQTIKMVSEALVSAVNDVQNTIK